jgi:hypothetical protein
MKDSIDELVVNQIYDYWRNKGFPYFDLSKEEKEQEFRKFLKFNYETIIQDQIVRQVMSGLGLLWSYFPHHWEVPIQNMKTPMEVWLDDDRLKKAIRARIKNNGFKLDDKGSAFIEPWSMRKGLSRASGAQRVSNFRPTAAAAIYNRYAGNGVVWDMSCGYGGRLLGAIGSSRVKTYLGTEPSTETFTGLTALSSDFAHKTNTSVKLFQQGSELGIDNYITQEVDLCFTSPPYFNTEKYSNEPTQSAIKFSTVELWNEGFLRETIKAAERVLKDTGYLILNVANVKTHKTLENDTVEIAKQEGFELKEVLKLTLSNITKGGFKYEPIFVFQAKGMK